MYGGGTTRLELATSAVTGKCDLVDATRFDSVPCQLVRKAHSFKPRLVTHQSVPHDGSPRPNLEPFLEPLIAESAPNLLGITSPLDPSSHTGGRLLFLLRFQGNRLVATIIDDLMVACSPLWRYLRALVLITAMHVRIAYSIAGSGNKWQISHAGHGKPEHTRLRKQHFAPGDPAVEQHPSCAHVQRAGREHEQFANNEVPG
jgi:hypothetical protein